MYYNENEFSFVRFMNRNELVLGDKVTIKNAYSVTVNNNRIITRLIWCSARSYITVVSCSSPRVDPVKASTVIPFGLLVSLPVSLVYALSKCDYDVRLLDDKLYSSFMDYMLKWTFGCKQVHPLLRFFKLSFSSCETSDIPFEVSRYKSVDQLVSAIRVMVFSDKRHWIQSLFIKNSFFLTS